MLLQNEDDVEIYIQDISIGTKNNSLGMICRDSDDLPMDHFTIKQSASLLYQHSTGAMVWSTTPEFGKWIRHSSYRSLVQGKTIVELGCGTGALATMLSDLAFKIIATDQKPLLKLCRTNCDNYQNSVSDSCPIYVKEFDWEKQDFNDEDIIHDSDPPVTIVACDTVYNEFLQEPFLQAIFSVWETCKNSAHALVAVQLRELTIIQDMLELILVNFDSVQVEEISPGFVLIVLERALLRDKHRRQ